MVEDASTIEMLKHNAKSIGGVLGTEEEFFSKNPGGPYFLEKDVLKIQDVTYSQIERT